MIMDGDGKANSLQSAWSLWQIVDSILPTGGFAHSYGLEAAMQLGSVQDSRSLEMFVVGMLENVGSLLLPFVYRCNANPDLQEWMRADQILHANLNNAVARRASMSQGSALLRVAAMVFVEIPQLKQMREIALAAVSCSDSAPGEGKVLVHVHHASVFGAITGFLGFDCMTAQRAYLFIALRDVLSSATRLHLIGPLQAASMQHSISAIAEQILMRYTNRPLEDACQVAPVLDFYQSYHDYLFSRLFRS